MSFGDFGQVGDLVSAIISPQATTPSNASKGTTVGNLLGNLVGSAEQVYGAYEKGQSSVLTSLQSATKQAQDAENYTYKAQESVFNSNIALLNAHYEAEKNAADVFSSNQNSYRTTGTQAAIQSASGVNINEGTALDVRIATAETNQLNTMLTSFQSKQREQGFNLQSQEDLRQADQNTKAAAAASKNSSAYKKAASKENTASILSSVTKSGNLLRAGANILGYL
jgi:hypothetical protein